MSGKIILPLALAAIVCSCSEPWHEPDAFPTPNPWDIECDARIVEGIILSTVSQFESMGMKSAEDCLDLLMKDIEISGQTIKAFIREEGITLLSATGTLTNSGSASLNSISIKDSIEFRAEPEIQISSLEQYLSGVTGNIPEQECLRLVESFNSEQSVTCFLLDEAVAEIKMKPYQDKSGIKPGFVLNFYEGSSFFLQLEL